VRGLIVTNMYPTAEQPAQGVFVRDQVRALRRLPDVEVDVFRLTPGNAASYVVGAGGLWRRHRRERFDIVHAHFGLTIAPSLAARGRARAVTLHGTDLAHPRSRAITLATLRFVDLVATVSEPLAAEVPTRSFHGVRAVLPCGVDVERFRYIDRAEARAALGLDPAGPYLLFPSDPRRPEKRYDRAVSVAAGVPLLTLIDVPPDEVPLWVNAANAVLVPSEREGFGLAVLEALACAVPVLATPVGVAPEALAGVDGAYCGPFDGSAWRRHVAGHLAAADPRLPGARDRAARFSSDAMAAKVLAAWKSLLS
jgi:teichuronic acid biosynthesis glycosyltransferase TuaC